MLAETSQTELIAHLCSVGLRPGMDVVVHSKLVAFGRLANAGDAVVNALWAALGKEATIAVPSYTFGSEPATPYDLHTTPSRNVGVLGEHVRRLPGAVRSRSPIHSHAAIGPKAALLAATPPTVSLGRGSDFEALEQAGFHLLLLGCKFNEGCTFLHHVEALAEVPYRHWLDLSRTVIDPVTATPQAITVRYYARGSEEWRNAFDTMQEPLRAAGLLQEAPAPYGRSFLVRLSDLRAIATEMLAANPYALVTRANPES
jgi:aminoglycoside N3'-acetyltransferase